MRCVVSKNNIWHLADINRTLCGRFTDNHIPIAYKYKRWKDTRESFYNPSFGKTCKICKRIAKGFCFEIRKEKK